MSLAAELVFDLQSPPVIRTEALARAPSSSLQNRRRPGHRANLRRTNLYQSSRKEEGRNTTYPKSYSGLRSTEPPSYLGRGAGTLISEMPRRASWFLH